jgi:hypothetical protein
MPNTILKGVLCWISVCIVLLATTACKTDVAYALMSASKDIEFETGDDKSRFSVSNPTDKDLWFALNINGRLYESTSALAAEIRALPAEDTAEHEVKKAWRFVRDNLAYNIPLTDQAWIHHPVILFNSLGFGQCDDLASGLAYVWQEMGYETRIWVLQGHVVPEVQVDGKWQMYDPSYHVYYLKKNQEVAGVRDLIQNPDLVRGLYGKLPINEFRNLAELNFKVLRYSEELVKIYGSGGEIATSWHLPKTNLTSTILLPKGASMEFPVNSPSPVVISNWKGMKRQLTHYVKFTIPKGWKGSFSSPFIISSISGMGKVQINGTVVGLQNFSIRPNLEDATELLQSFIVKEASSDIEVYAIFNPNIINYKGKNVITTQGKNCDSLQISIRKGEVIYPTLTNHVLDFRLNPEPEHFVRFELQKDTLLKIMRSPQNPILSEKDMLENLQQYFLLWHVGNARQKEARTQEVYEKMVRFYEQIPEDTTKKEVLRFMSDPLSFVMLIYILEHYPESTILEMI